jgi:hypothetical protein
METYRMSERNLDLVALAARTIQAGDAALSDLLRRRLRETLPDSATARALAAALDLSRGDLDGSVREIESALRLDPTNLNANLEATRIYPMAGQPRRAVIHSQRVLDEIPDFPGLREHYINYAFANSDYRDFLGLVHACLAPSIYLETGVEYGRSFKSARGAEIAIGIDPQLAKVPPEYHDWGRLFEMTSDDFFAAGHYEDTCGDRPIDTAFIDGMHLFEYTLRDFINIERRAHAHSAVLIHDIIPMTTTTGARLRQTGTWMGDVWKIMVVLTRYRPDLDLNVIDAGPSGLAVVRRVDPSSRKLSDHYNEIVADLMDLPLEHGFLDRLGVKRVPAEENAIRELLAS